jgi:hypothetical protein
MEFVLNGTFPYSNGFVPTGWENPFWLLTAIFRK